ncbi:MAG: hypothetical protein IPN54_02385 [Bacteroidetes bacterium]|nr:hypothetical protein [Bacteroidota bacterium]
MYGSLNELSQSDDPNYYEIVCSVIAPPFAPFDPNNKVVSPMGTQPQSYISPDQTMEYQINFQNIGTGPATYVMIKDSISADLDISTLVPGVSSHNYSFNIYGNGVAEWVFPNIYLPDSASNEPASKGFVKFKIKQQPNNPFGTEINNDAYIYFDFNDRFK